jgi:hypothetical protein
MVRARVLSGMDGVRVVALPSIEVGDLRVESTVDWSGLLLSVVIVP